MSTTEKNISLERSNKVDVYTQENINHYYNNKSHIENRLRQLEKEISIEEIFQLHDSAHIMVGVILSVTTRKQKWLLLPLVIAIVQAAQAATGLRLGTTLLRNYGFRTKNDIDKEKFALKALRGDFHYEIEVPNAIWDAVNK